MLKKLLFVVLVAVAGVVGYALTRPDRYRIEREVSIEAPAPVVFAQLDDLKAWQVWSPWEGRDPQMKKNYGGAPRGVGATCAWQGNNRVGEGMLTITGSQPPTALTMNVDLIKPVASIATTRFAIAPQGPSGVKVTWSIDGTNDLVGKLMGLFVNTEQTIGAEFERGLGALKQVSEAEATKQAAAAAAAQAAAAEAAAAERARQEAAAAAPPPNEGRARAKRAR